MDHFFDRWSMKHSRFLLYSGNWDSKYTEKYHFHSPNEWMWTNIQSYEFFLYFSFRISKAAAPDGTYQ